MSRYQSVKLLQHEVAGKSPSDLEWWRSGLYRLLSQEPDDILSKILQVDVAMIGFILPHLDIVDLLSLTETSTNFEEIILTKRYWKSFLKESLKQNKYDSFIQEYGPSYLNKLRISTDPVFFHKFGCNLAKSIRSLRAKLSGRIEDGRIYATCFDCTRPKHSHLADEFACLNCEKVLVDESCQFVIGLRKLMDEERDVDLVHIVNVWRIIDNGNLSLTRSFDIDPNWTRTLVLSSFPGRPRLEDERLFSFTLGNHLMYIYQLGSSKFMTIWDWKRGVKTRSSHNVDRLDEFLNCNEFSQIEAKKGLIVTGGTDGQGLKTVRVWKGNQNWSSLERKIPHIQTDFGSMDFDERHLVISCEYRIHVWSMTDGTKVHQVNMYGNSVWAPQFILFNQRLLVTVASGPGSDSGSGTIDLRSSNAPRVDQSRPMLQELINQDKYIHTYLQSGDTRFLTFHKVMQTKSEKSVSKFVSTASGPLLTIWDFEEVVQRTSQGHPSNFSLVVLKRFLLQPCPQIEEVYFDGFRLIVCYLDAIEVFTLWESVGAKEMAEWKD